MKKYILPFILSLTTPGMAVASTTLEKRLEQLEKRVLLLEQQLGGQKQGGNASRKISDVGYIQLRYWLGNQESFPARDTSPRASGKFKLGSDFYFHPRTYNIEDDSMFSHFDDPSRFPLVTLNVDGTLLPPTAGTYQLLVKPTPPREVGGSGNVELSIDIYVDNRRIFTQDFSSTLRPTTIQLELPEHAVSFRMEAIARSPGFGPSPTRAKIFVGLQGNNTATPEPIANYLSLPQ